MSGKRSSKSGSRDNGDSLVVGIDLGGTHFQVGVVDGNGVIVGRARGLTRANGGGDEDGVVERLVEGVREACHQAGVLVGGEVRRIGIGAPSPIDSSFGVALEAVNLGWKDYPLGVRMREELGGEVRVTLDNDVNCAVWGEFVMGAARGFSSVLGLWIGTGIGGGFVFDGRLFHGARGTAGEIGRAVLYPDKRHGEWVYEDWASRKSMVRRIGEAVARGERCVFSERFAGGEEGTVSSADIAQAVENHDETVSWIVRDSARLTGIMAANACTLLSLDGIVIGGGIAEEMGEVYAGWMRESFEEAVFPNALRGCAIVVTELKDNAGLLGAALLARERLG